MFFLWLVFLQLILFTIVILFLRFYLSRNVSRATTHLNELNQEYSLKSEEAKKKLEAAVRYYDEMVLKAKIDAEKTRVQILNEVQEAQQAAVNESRKQSADILEQANRARESMLKEVDRRIEAGAVEKAGELMQVVFPPAVGEIVHAYWVKELLSAGLEDLGRLNVPESLEEAQVTTAYPLKKDEKATLETKLREKLKRTIRVSEKTDPSLLAGLGIALGGILIDGSLRFQIRAAVRHAQQSV